MRIDGRLWKSRRQEKQGMERFGGVQNPRSGSRWDRRNDGRTTTELVEFKRTDNQRSITLKHDDLDALYKHAVAESRLPVLVFELAGRDWVVLPEPDYHELALHRPAPGNRRDLRAVAPRLAKPGQMLGKLHREPSQPVLRRVPVQQQPGAGGQERLPGNPPGPPRPLPGPRPLPRLRNSERGEVRGLGRVQRKGASPDQAATSP